MKEETIKILKEQKDDQKQEVSILKDITNTYWTQEN